MNVLARLAAWYARLSFSQAALLYIAIFVASAILACVAVWYFDPRKVEMRAILRRRRKDRRTLISARELARRREDVDVRVSRRFIRAYRERCL